MTTAVEQRAPSVEALELVREYRRAARMAVDATDKPLGRRLIALLDLADAARSEQDAWTREMAEQALWEEARPLLGAEGDEPAIPGDPVEVAARQLRARGYESCPTCARRLHGAMDCERWRRIRLADAERRDARRKAVEP